MNLWGNKKAPTFILMQKKSLLQTATKRNAISGLGTLSLLDSTGTSTGFFWEALKKAVLCRFVPFCAVSCRFVPVKSKTSLQISGTYPSKHVKESFLHRIDYERTDFQRETFIIFIIYII